MRNKNMLARKSNKRALKIILWTVFALVILAGVTYASWYFLINPETRAGGPHGTEKVDVEVTQTRYFASVAVHEKVGGYSKDELNYVQKIWNKANQDPGSAITTLDKLLGEVVTGYPSDVNPKTFKLAKAEETRKAIFSLPRYSGWYRIGDVGPRGVETIHSLKKVHPVVERAVTFKSTPQELPGRKYVGFTHYESKVVRSDKVESFLSDSRDKLDKAASYDYQQGYSLSKFKKGARTVWKSYFPMLTLKYKSGKGEEWNNRNVGEYGDITKAFRDVGNKSTYEYHRGLGKRGLDYKDDRVYLTIKPKNIKKNNVDISRGDNLYFLPTLTARRYPHEVDANDPKADEVKRGTFNEVLGAGMGEYRGAKGDFKNVDFYSLMGSFVDNQEYEPSISPDRVIRFLDLNWGVEGEYFNGSGFLPIEYRTIRQQNMIVGMNPHIFQGFAKDKSLRLKMRKVMEGGENLFHEWQKPSDLQGSYMFRVGKERDREGNSIPVKISLAGKNYKLYPTMFFYRANKDVFNDALNWMYRFGKSPITPKKVKNIVVYSWALKINNESPIDLEISKNNNFQAPSDLLFPYRTAISFMRLKDYAASNMWGYNGKEAAPKIASVDITSDPLNEIAPGELGEVNREKDTTWATLVNNGKDVKITWGWKNFLKPQSYKIYRGKTENFTPSQGGYVGTQDDVNNLEFVDRSARLLKQNPKTYYWYRVVATYPGGKVSLPSRAVQPRAGPEGKKLPPEGEKPLKPTDVDAFGLPKKIELTWKPGSTAEAEPLQSGGTKSKTTKTKGQRVKGKTIQEGGVVGNKEFDVYRTTVDPAPKGKKVETSFFLDKLVNTAFAAVARPATQGGWERIAREVQTKTSDGKKYLYDDKGLKNGKEYWYRVIETNLYGQSPASDYDADIPHKHEDVNKDGYVNWIDVTRVLIYPQYLGRAIPSRDVTEDVNNDDRVDWTDIYGSGTKRGILKYPTFPEVIGVTKAQPVGGGSRTRD